MADDYATRRYTRWYRRLLWLYPKDYRQRFGRQMLETFDDLCRERRSSGDRLFGLFVWASFDTSAGIVKENMNSIRLSRESLIFISAGTGLILLIAMFANFFSQEFNWALPDFILMGVLLFGLGFVIDVIARQAGKYRLLATLLAIALFVYVRAELAVGILTDLGS